MNISKKQVILITAVFIITISTCYYIKPFVQEINSGIQSYETRIAYRDDYKLHTSPLSKNVTKDICVKLKIIDTSDNCRHDIEVYAPELFDEIKTYFYNIPNEDRTLITVQNYLGEYEIDCEKPDPDGYFRCKYDLRGDNMYPFYFLFNKDNFYYEIIANIGGS